MTAWNDGAGRQAEPNFTTAAEAALTPDPEPGLLEKVLERTLDVGDSAEPLAPCTRAAIFGFARQSAPATELSEPLLADLVRVVLKDEIEVLAGHSSWQTVTDQVAHSIWEDPTARERMLRVWSLLQRQGP